MFQGKANKCGLVRQILEEHQGQLSKSECFKLLQERIKLYPANQQVEVKYSDVENGYYFNFTANGTSTMSKPVTNVVTEPKVEPSEVTDFTVEEFRAARKLLLACRGSVMRAVSMVKFVHSEMPESN